MTERSPARKKTLSRRPAGWVQRLEDRRLFAVITVTGHNPADNGANDLAAVQAAIAASSNGDTILFDGGVYNLSGFGGANPADGLLLPGSRIYKGINGAVLKGQASNGQLVTVKSDNVLFTGLTFTGGGVFLDRQGQPMNKNITFDNNVFNINSTGGNKNGITFTSGLQDSRISNNYFTGNVNASFGVYGINYKNLLIANNELVNIRAGFHIDAFGASGDLVVEQNLVSHAKGMGFEFQSQATNLIFRDNWYEHPDLSTTFSQNNGTMAFSLILDKSTNILIQRNTVIAPERPDGVGTRIGFEVGGDNSLVEDNYINGINHALAMNDGVGTASVVARNNRFMNYLQGPSNTFPSNNPSRTLTLINNGPTVQLTPTMEARIAAQQKPGIGAKRYGDPLPDPDDNPDEPPPPPPPPPPPDPPPNAATNLTIGNVGYGFVQLNWTDNSSDETDFQIQLLGADGVTWQVVGTAGADDTTFTVNGVASGQTYQFRVIAHNTNGYSDPTNTAAAQTPVPDVLVTSVTSPRRTRPAFIYQNGTSSAVSPPLTGGS
jgi:hypothetical protein